MSLQRAIPSIDRCLQRPAIDALVQAHGRAAVVQALRRAADEWRERPNGDALMWMESRVPTLLDATGPSLRDVINATGVIVHTNLGRAPLAAEALARVMDIGRGYTNLEYDIAAGSRGHRHVHAERLLCALTGAAAAAVTNNNAAATMLVLGAVAAGREVIVSRGELVEIGGGFRVPDIMAQSGAVLREVGTTNRTRVSDYTAAVSERTALILRVHPSNFRIEGFTERPSLRALAEAAHGLKIPLFEDLGSGWLGLDHTSPWPEPLQEEPSVRDSLAAGVDLVAFSGDKLLGGPQAGIVTGRSDLIERVRRHPLMRAVRADKLTYAALETTLQLWAHESRREHIPLVRMVLMSVSALDNRASSLAEPLANVPGLTAAVINAHSTIGGGSAPQSVLPTRVVALRHAHHSAAALEAALRRQSPPVIARIQDDAVLLDPRTIAPEQDQSVVAAVKNACQELST